jgi:hypothetical protein
MLKRCPLREDVKRANVASPRLPINLYKYDKHHLPDVKGARQNLSSISRKSHLALAPFGFQVAGQSSSQISRATLHDYFWFNIIISV